MLLNLHSSDSLKIPEKIFYEVEQMGSYWHIYFSNKKSEAKGYLICSSQDEVDSWLQVVEAINTSLHQKEQEKLEKSS